MYTYRPSHMAEQNQDYQLEHTFSSSVRIRDVVLKTCQRRWTIGRNGERGLGISVLTAWHDDDDDDIYIYIYIYIYINCKHIFRKFNICFGSIFGTVEWNVDRNEEVREGKIHRGCKWPDHHVCDRKKRIQPSEENFEKKKKKKTCNINWKITLFH